MLELIGKNGPLGVSESARLLGWKKSSAHRILSTFEMMGYLKQDQQTGKYSFGYRIFQLVENFRGLAELRRIALPFLSSLQKSTGETINLGILDGGEVIFVERINSSHVLQTIIPIGSRAPLHCTAIGKLFVGELEENARRMPLSINRRRYTRNTLVSMSDLLSEIRRTKERGYAVDNEE
jgi:DNA-binding IclR family transcriptional regulator